MFSKMSAERFEKVQESNIGPGSYELPTCLDDHATAICCGERFQEHEKSVGSLHVYNEDVEPMESRRKSRSTSRTPFGERKENKVPNATEKLANKGLESLELDQMRRRLAAEEKLRAQAEAKVADIAMAKKSATNAHSQMQAKEKKIEELQKKVDELSSSHKEARRRACELETESGTRKKTLVEKDQTIAQLQKSLGNAKAQLDERGRKVEELSSQVTETEHMRKEVAGMRERLQAAAAGEVQLKEKTAEVTKFKEAAAEQARAAAAALEEAGAARAAVLEAAIRSFDGLVERIFDQAEADQEGVRQLTEEHERLRQSALAQVREARDRAGGLEAALRKSRGAEAELASQLAVKEASLAAALELREKERAAQAEELRAAREEERSEGERRLGAQLAELRGRLYTAESARDLSAASQKELERQLAASKESDLVEAQQLQGEVTRLQAELAAAGLSCEAEQEAREQLARQLEEESSSLLQAQLQNEALTAEAEAMRGSWLKDEARARAREEELDESLRAEAQKRQAESAAIEEERRSLTAQAKRAGEDIAAMERSCEEERGQNRELLASIEVLRRDSCALQAENQVLKDAEAALKGDLEGVLDDRAKMAGHANHRQKIQYTHKLKEDNLMLRSELQKAQNRVRELNVLKIGAPRSSPAALKGKMSPSPARVVGDAGQVRAASPRLLQVPPMPVLGRGGARPSTSRQAPAAAAAAEAHEDAGLTAAEAARRGRMQERALERVTADYRHLLELLEHASLSEKGEAAAAVLEKLRRSSSAAPSDAAASARPAADGETNIRKDLAGVMDGEVDEA